MVLLPAGASFASPWHQLPFFLVFKGEELQKALVGVEKLSIGRSNCYLELHPAVSRDNPEELSQGCGGVVVSREIHQLLLKAQTTGDLLWSRIKYSHSVE